MALLFNSQQKLGAIAVPMTAAEALSDATNNPILRLVVADREIAARVVDHDVRRGDVLLPAYTEA
jgi:hypothetical protein